MVNHLNKRTINSALATLLGARVYGTKRAVRRQRLDLTADIRRRKSVERAAPNASPLPAGTTLEAELTKPVDARKSNPGDRVLAKVTHGVKVNGSVVIPKGSSSSVT
jgi:hypothetical protein